MNILDMNDIDLRSVCSHASQSLMWDGRQQTEPAEMHRYALAAACAEMYPDALRHFRRDKVLAAFDLSLTDNERDGIYADMESNGGRLGIEASAKLSAFLNATAIRHVALDEYSALDSMRGGFPTTNFGAVMELCAGEVSGTDLVSPAQHASELRSGAHLGKENDMDAKAIKELKEFNTDNPKTEVEQTTRGSEPEHPVIGGDEVWKQKNVLIDRNGDDALVMRKMADGSREFVVAHDYDEETGHWGHGTYYDSLASAAADLEGRAISAPGMEVICPDFWYRDDIEFALEEAGLEVNDENVDAALEALDLDGEPILSNFHDRLAETGNEMIADSVDGIEPDDTDGLDLDAEARDMRGVADGMTDRQLGTPSLGGQGR